MLLSTQSPSAKRVVIKIGSALLARPERDEWVAALAGDAAALRAQGCEVVIVSSGAVALGRVKLGMGSSASRLDEKQAAAAAGQVELIRLYERAFEPHGLSVAQALLTLDNTETRPRWLNARATLNRLLALGALPIVNENDTVATSELRYGDNDRLAARVAEMLGADGLVLLSDVDGLYDADPRSNRSAAHIPVVSQITPEIEAMAGGANQAAGVGSGGMASKITAAMIAARAGAWTLIMDGRPTAPLTRLDDGARSTLFEAETTPMNARKRWIAGALHPTGALTVDDGALSALRNGKSLLPAGVVAARGAFTRGDAVSICGPSGAEIARGLAGYDARETQAILGKRSDDIEAALGYRRGVALVHRDDLVMMEAAHDD